MRFVTLLFLLASTGVCLNATELMQNGDFNAPSFTGMGQSNTFTDWVETGFGDANGSAASNPTPGGAYNQVLRLGSSQYARQDITTSWTAEHKFLLTFNAKEIWWRGGNTGDQVWVTIRDVSIASTRFARRRNPALSKLKQYVAPARSASATNCLRRLRD